MSDFAKKIVNGENLQSFAGKMKQHIFEDLLGSKKIKYITQAEYEALTDDQKNNENIVWNIIDIDIIDYVTEEELIAKTYATETYVINKIAEAELNDKEINLDGFATKDELNAKADKTELHSHSNKTILDGITSAKITEWNNKSTFSGNYNDLTNKPTIPTVPTNISSFINDSGYITSIPSEYITDSELTAKGYAKTSDLHSHSNKSVLDNITSAKVTEWNNKSTFSGSYNDLTNKPTIPSAYTHPATHPAGMITGLSTVAITGSYNDLTNKPTIPSITNDLTNTLKANYDAAYAHSISAHAPVNAQKNSDITKAEIEAKLVGTITSHTHNGISGYNMWAGTQLEYDLISNKDSSTLYFIIKED